MNGDIESPGNRLQGQRKKPASKAKKKWSELSPARKARIVVQLAIQCSLTAWTLWDLNHRPASQINGDKRWWMLGAFVQPFGPIAYLLFGRKKK
jgi:hypothetical protein